MTTLDSTAILRRLAALTAEMADMRSALDIQFKRTAAMQAEIDLLPSARRRRRDAIRIPTPPPSPSRHNGNGNGSGG